MIVTEQSFGNTAQEFYTQAAAAAASKNDDEQRQVPVTVEKATEERSPLYRAEDKPLV